MACFISRAGRFTGNYRLCKVYEYELSGLVLGCTLKSMAQHC